MSYATFEGSVEAGRPVEIYHFSAGTKDFFYTSAQNDHTVGAQVYTAVDGIQRSSTVGGTGNRDTDFKVVLPTSDPVAQIFTGLLPGIRVRLQVSRFHINDTPTPEVVRVFDGFVQTSQFKQGGKEVTLVARVELASIGKQIPRRTYQSACNHILYEPNTCKVDDTDPAFRASALDVTSLVGNVLTVTSGIQGVYADGFMNGGYVESIADADFRLITTQVGNVLTLFSSFATTPTSVNVLAGCAHTIAVCSSKFANTIEFGGFAFVPTRNPFEEGL